MRAARRRKALRSAPPVRACDARVTLEAQSGSSYRESRTRAAHQLGVLVHHWLDPSGNRGLGLDLLDLGRKAVRGAAFALSANACERLSQYSDRIRAYRWGAFDVLYRANV